MEKFVLHVPNEGETLRAFRRVRLLRWPALVLAIVALALLRAGASQAVQLTVCPGGCHYTTIAAALAAAHDGDTIAVGPGTYAGEFTINRSIRLAGAGQAATTIAGP